MKFMPSSICPAQAMFKDGALYSAEYGDIYHSVDGAIDEARHVFIAGNGLSRRWQKAAAFTIVETGFGCGLNFLATWDALKRSGTACRLNFVSVEKCPFSAEDLGRILNAWPQFKALTGDLLASYPPLIRGFHRLHFDGGKVTLTLLLGDAVEMLADLDAQADAFFLDGFAPGRNPDMWSDAIFEQVARLAAPGATAATYSAAAVVRTGLEGAGFSADKVPGFGRKRDMLTAQYPGARSDSRRTRNAVVIGAGIAGASCAFALARRGIDVNLLDCESAPGRGGSANPAAIVRPFPSLDTGVRNAFSWAAFLYAVRLYRELSARTEFDWRETGVLQLARSPTHHDKLVRAVAMLGYPPEVVRLVNAHEATQLSGVRVNEDGVWFPTAGFVDGQALCTALVESAPKSVTFIGGVDARVIQPEGETVHITDTDENVLASADIAILANGLGAQAFIAGGASWMRAVRGQVTEFIPTNPQLRAPVCRDGYVTPQVGQRHFVGATYDEARTDAVITDDDHEVNLRRAAKILPEVFDKTSLVEGTGWAAVRCASRDRLPVIGAIDSKLLCCVAMGSRGFSWAPLAAETLASLVTGAPLPIERTISNRLSRSRFLTATV